VLVGRRPNCGDDTAGLVLNDGMVKDGAKADAPAMKDVARKKSFMM